MDFVIRPPEIAINGGGLNEVATTGSTSTPVCPKAALSSRHNNDKLSPQPNQVSG